MNRLEQMLCVEQDDKDRCVTFLRILRKYVFNPTLCREYVKWVECLPRCKNGIECVEVPEDEILCDVVYDEECIKACLEKWYDMTCMNVVPEYMFVTANS